MIMLPPFHFPSRESSQSRRANHDNAGDVALKPGQDGEHLVEVVQGDDKVKGPGDGRGRRILHLQQAKRSKREITCPTSTVKELNSRSMIQKRSQHQALR